MDKWKCVTCGMLFEYEPGECPSCRQTLFQQQLTPGPRPVSVVAQVDPEDEDPEPEYKPRTPTRVKQPARAPRGKRKTGWKFSYAFPLAVI